MSALFLGQPRTRGEHVQALDGLRGLAVLIVIASHLSNAGWLPQPGMSGTGKSGVYLFFVLSAYLLAHAMLARPVAGLAAPSYWIDYAVRRVLRIWPLYLVILLLSFGLTSLGVSGWHYQMDGAAFWRHLVLREGQDVLWSIPVEFTFYLWLPFICLGLVALRALPGGRWWGLGLLTCLLVLSRWRWPAAEAPVNSVQLGYYMPVFLAGVGAAWVGHAWPSWLQQVRAWRVTGWLLLALLAVATPAIWSAVLGGRLCPGLEPSLVHRIRLGVGAAPAVGAVGRRNAVAVFCQFAHAAGGRGQLQRLSVAHAGVAAGRRVGLARAWSDRAAGGAGRDAGGGDGLVPAVRTPLARRAAQLPVSIAVRDGTGARMTGRVRYHSGLVGKRGGVTTCCAR